MFKLGIWFAAILFCGASLWAQGNSKRLAEVKLIDSIQGKDLFKAYCASCHLNYARKRDPAGRWREHGRGCQGSCSESALIVLLVSRLFPPSSVFPDSLLCLAASSCGYTAVLLAVPSRA
jgi:hypothetical protein